METHWVTSEGRDKPVETFHRDGRVQGIWNGERSSRVVRRAGITPAPLPEWRNEG